jgi:hypothetical protein
MELGPLSWSFTKPAGENPPTTRRREKSLQRDGRHLEQSHYRK